MTRTAKSKEEEIPGRRASRSRGNFQGDGEGKSKGEFIAPATGTKLSQNQGAGAQEGVSGRQKWNQLIIRWNEGTLRAAGRQHRHKVSEGNPNIGQLLTLRQTKSCKRKELSS